MLKVYCLFLFAISLAAQDFETIIFKDDFNNKVINKRWLFYMSESIQENGKLICKMPNNAKHSSVNYLKYEPSADLELSLKFKFSGEVKYFGIIFNDKKFKGSHAGHICNIHITPVNIQLREGKTGVFEHSVRKRIKNKSLDEKTNEMLRSKEKNFKYKFQKDRWYKLKIVIKGAEMCCIIDDKNVGKLYSKGIAHKTKNSMGLSVWGQSVHIDDFCLKGQ